MVQGQVPASKTADLQETHRQIWNWESYPFKDQNLSIEGKYVLVATPGDAYLSDIEMLIIAPSM
jgi:hypothetical protein